MANSDENNSDKIECLYPTCTRNFDSEMGMKSHAGKAHDIEPILKEDLQSIAEKLGRAPTMEEMDEMGLYTQQTYQKHFGTWNDALQSAGLDINKAHNIDEKDLISELKRLADELDTTPTAEQMDNQGKYTAPTYQEQFGSWNEAVRKADLPANHEEGFTEEELLNELRRLTEELGKVPTSQEMASHGDYSLYTYNAYFGSWNNALDLAGLPVNRDINISREELVKELNRLHDQVGQTPTASDMDKHGDFSASVYMSRFDSWNSALEAAGLELNKRHSPSGSKEMDIDEEALIEDLKRVGDAVGHIPRVADVQDDEISYSHGTYIDRFGSWREALKQAGYDLKNYRDMQSVFGPDWEERRKEVRKRDNYQCVLCGISESDLRRELDVHHIRPRKEFMQDGEYKWEEGNKPSNLVSVCQTCHVKIPERDSTLWGSNVEDFSSGTHSYSDLFGGARTD